MPIVVRPPHVVRADRKVRRWRLGCAIAAAVLLCLAVVGGLTTVGMSDEALTTAFAPAVGEIMPGLIAHCARATDYAAYASPGDHSLSVCLPGARASGNDFLHHGGIVAAAPVRGRVLAWDAVRGQAVSLTMSLVPASRCASAADARDDRAELTLVALVAGHGATSDLWPRRSGVGGLEASAEPITTVCLVYLPQRRIFGPIGIEPGYNSLPAVGRAKVHPGGTLEYPEHRWREGWRADLYKFVQLLLAAEESAASE